MKIRKGAKSDKSGGVKQRSRLLRWLRNVVIVGICLCLVFLVTIAVLRATGRQHLAEGRGFRTTNLAAPAGAAVACAKLLALDPAQALNALGIAGACQNSGLMASLGAQAGEFAMDKDMVNGLSAQLGVLAAELAGDGLSGPTESLS